MEHLFDPASYTEAVKGPAPNLSQPSEFSEWTSPEHVSRMISAAQFGRPSIRFPSSKTGAIINSGRFKNTFEVPWEKDENYQDTRMDVEDAKFGYDQRTPNEERPVYGYMARPGDPNSSTTAYGDAKAVLKPSVLPRTTLTYGDSFEDAAVPLSHAQAATGKFDPKYAQHYIPQGPRYIEAQYHGGLKTSDISHIEGVTDMERSTPGSRAIATEHTAGIARLLGVPYRVLGRTDAHQSRLEQPHMDEDWRDWARKNRTGLPPILHHAQFEDVYRSPDFKNEYW